MNSQNEGLKSLSSIRGTSTEPWLLHLMQINDSAFPIGSFAHSFGMETYIQENVICNERDVLKFCTMYLCHSLATTDAIIVKEAYALAKKNDIQGLLHLEKICHGIKLAPEARKGSEMIGRQFFKTVYSFSSEKLLTLWNKKLKNREVKGHYSVVYGMYTALRGIDVKVAVETFLYSSITAIVQNAVRAIPLGQMSGVKIIFSLLPVIQEVAGQVIKSDLDDLVNNSIAFEIASMKHEFLHSRIFIS